MHRTQLLALLDQYRPTGEPEIAFKQQIIQFVQDHTDCFERSLQIGHITASTWLLNYDQSKALLMHHAKLDQWFQLGGHCDGNPDVLAVAIKEAQEESGIQDIQAVSPAIFDVDIHLIPESKKEPAHYHYDIRFLLQVTSNEEPIQNNESKELRWISKNPAELPTDSPSVTRMFNKWIEKYDN
jgi:8-oxo-dGTP pyrophosphatase MutT (NUDIX family)